MRLTAHEGNTTNLLPRLLAGHLDAAMLHLPLDEPEIDVEPLFAEDLVLLLPCGHHLAGRESVTLAELAAERLMLPLRGTMLRRVIDRATQHAGVELQSAVEIDGVRLLTSLAARRIRGHDRARDLGAQLVARRLLVGVCARTAARVVGWVQRRRPTPGAPTRALLNVLREVVLDQGSRQPGVQVGGEAVSALRGG